MKEITRMAIVSLAKTDETITPEQMRAGLKALAGETPEPSGSDIINNRASLDRLLTVAQVGALINRSPKSVLRFCKQGLLTRSVRRGGVRATGILESSVRAFIAGKEVA